MRSRLTRYVLCACAGLGALSDAGAIGIPFETSLPRYTGLSERVEFSEELGFRIDLSFGYDERGRIVTGPEGSEVDGVPVEVRGVVKRNSKGRTRYRLIAVGEDAQGVSLRLKIRGTDGDGAVITYRGPRGKGKASVSLSLRASFQDESFLSLFPSVDERGVVSGRALVRSAFTGAGEEAGVRGTLRRGKLSFKIKSGRTRIAFKGRVDSERGAPIYRGELKYSLPPAKGSLDISLPDLEAIAGLVPDLVTGMSAEPGLAFEILETESDVSTLAYSHGGAFGEGLLVLTGRRLERIEPDGSQTALTDRFFGSVSTQCDRSASLGGAAFGMHVSTSRTFGEAVYLGSFNGPNPCDFMARLTPDGSIAAFAVGSPEGVAINSVGGIAESFGGAFGTFLYASLGGQIGRIDASGRVEVFAEPRGSINGLVFAHEDYSSRLLLGDHQGGRILSVDHEGSVEVFLEGLNGPRGLAFGQGGGWGEWLYVVDLGDSRDYNSTRLLRVLPDGSHEVVLDGLEASDPAFGELVFTPASYGHALFIGTRDTFVKVTPVR